MTDYGHELLFGTFITPVAQPVHHALELAVVSDRAGLDLVTFQDHPYQSAFLDTWTLLSWVAAQTERVRVSGNVVNLPLRPPAVLARAAASLDLLSGGRFELGLGAGAFWDAIEAMGGTRRSPGEAVEALSEAIDIIRAIWDVSERGGVRVDGRHYRVWGAKRGPEPAHDISIWVGALRPRMLWLIGEKADGWLPSLSYMADGDLERGNRIIDEAATAYAHRHQNFNISSVGLGASEDDFHRHWDELRPHLDGLYLSFETDRRPERLHDAFPGETLTKLRWLKAKYDPDNVFNQNFPIPPAPHERLRGAAPPAIRRGA